MKWWLFAGSVFFILLALVRNFDGFNDFMFHYLPMYNKFRTVEMALVIPGLVFPIIGVWGLKEILSGAVDDARFRKGLLASLAFTGGRSLILWLRFSFFLRCPISVAGLVLQRVVAGSCLLGLGRCLALVGFHPVGRVLVVLVLSVEKSHENRDLRNLRIERADIVRSLDGGPPLSERQ